MSRLFSYTIPIDDGAAPNPFHGLCTLAICKPSIRRVAKEDDWVVGLGSVNAPSGNLGGKVVYAMRVQKVISLAEYDSRAKEEWPHRIPYLLSNDIHDRLGDCIYDYSAGAPPFQRASVHGPENISVDLGGENVLISRDFYYFGNRAIPLPEKLLPICHQGRGHKSNANVPYFDSFVFWIRGAGYAIGTLHGDPDTVLNWTGMGKGRSCIPRSQERFDDPVC